MRLGLGLGFCGHVAPMGEGGGGGQPDWVPENALIHIDLVRAFNGQDAAWTADDGVVSVDTLLGADANANSGWGSTTSFDPEDLTADGYVGSEVAFIGEARSALLATFTATISTKKVANEGVADNAYPLIIVAANGNDALQMQFSAAVQWSSWNGNFYVQTADVLNQSSIGSLNKVAVTVAGSRGELAANGSSVEVDVIGNDDRPSGNPLAAALFWGNGAAISAITIYDPLPSTDGLSELSEVS